MHKKIGILGGMGPEATGNLFNKIVKLTTATCDQEHIPIIVDNNPIIPDRTAFLLGKGANPLKELVKSAIRLELMGADVIIMPCNTAHFLYDEIKEFVDVPFINMVEITARYIHERFGDGAKVGLLATRGTYMANVYEKYSQQYQIHIIKPNQQQQELVLEVIYDIKKGNKENHKEKLMDILKEYKGKGISAVVLGCTELPLLFTSLMLDDDVSQLEIEFIDSTDLLARAAVEEVTGCKLKDKA